MQDRRDSLPATAVAKARREGLQALVTAAPKWAVTTAATTANLAARRRLRRIRYRRQGIKAIPDPTETIEIDPATVTHLVPFSRFEETDPRALLGTIRDGDWERDLPSIESQPKYEACRARVEDGVSWADTGIVDHLAERLEVEESIEHGCESRADLLDRYESERESLYRSLATEGYDRSVSPVCCRVHVGRNGELLFGEGGRHRFYLSRILGIGSVPVQVLCRHRQWQTVRDAVAEAESRESLPQGFQRFLGHPDLRDLQPNAAGTVEDTESWETGSGARYVEHNNANSTNRSGNR